MGQHPLTVQDYISLPLGKRIPGLNAVNSAPKEGDLVVRFDSLGEYIQAARTLPLDNAKFPSVEGEYDLKWYNGRTFADALRLAENGAQEYTEKAEALLQELSDATPDAPRRVWTPSPAGAYPVVPEALAGGPTPMRELRSTMDYKAPISIYITSTCSAGVSAEKMLTRGLAILALVQKLQEVRPVELYLLDMNASKGNAGNSIIVTRLETKPMNLSVLGFVFADAAMSRRLGHKINFSLRPESSSWGLWPEVFHTGKVEQYLGLNPWDLYLPPAHLQEKITDEPVKWINEMLIKTAGMEGRNNAITEE